MYRHPDKFDCENCKNFYHCTAVVDDPDWPLSQGVAPFEFDEIQGLGKFNTCLKPMVTAKSYFFLRLYRHYKNGVLPYGGGLLEQPAAYMRAMEIIESAMAS